MGARGCFMVGLWSRLDAGLGARVAVANDVGTGMGCHGD